MAVGTYEYKTNLRLQIRIIKPKETRSHENNIK